MELPKTDPRTQGTKQTHGFYCPEALWKEVERATKIDGYSNTSKYLVDILCAALRAREQARVAEAASRHNK